MQKVLGVCLLLGWALAGTAWAKSAPVTVIRGGTIHTVSQGTIQNGLIFIQNGKITAVVAKGKIPAGAKVIDATGRHIIPGMIDARSLAYRANSRLSSREETALDYLNYFDKDVARLKAHGVTAVQLYIQPTSSIGGKSSVIKLHLPPYNKQVVVTKSSGLRAIFGRNNGLVVSPLQRLNESKSWEKTFLAARKYQMQKKQYQLALKKYQAALARLKSGKKTATPPAKKKPPVTKGSKIKKKAPVKTKTPPPSTKKKVVAKKPVAKKPVAKKKLLPPRPFRTQPLYEDLSKVLAGKMPLMVRVHRMKDILILVSLAQKYKFRLVLDGGTEAYLLASRIAKYKPMVILEPPVDSYGTTLDYQYQSAKAAALLAKSKIAFAIASRGRHTRESAYLRLYAATAVANGLSADQALKAITLWPAQILGVSHRLGSLSKGKDADLVILSGPPLDARSRVQQVWISGKVVHQSPK